MRYILLTILGLSLLTACTPAITTPMSIPTQPLPTATPTAVTSATSPTLTPASQWGIAFATLPSYELLGPERPTRLYLIRCDGSDLTPLTGEIEHLANLTASPDGRHLLFIANREDTNGDGWPGFFDLPHLYIVDVQSNEIFTLTSGTTTMEWSATWSPDGEQLAFVSSEVSTPCAPCPPCYEEICTPMVTEFHTHLYVMNRDGTDKRRLTSQEGDVSTVAWSPTGEQIAFERDGAIWVINPDGSDLFKVAETPIEYHWRPYTAQPVWSPDGRRIAFVAPGVGEDKNADIFIVNADGSDLLNLTQHSEEDFQPAWSPDGQYIAFVTTRRGNWAVYITDTDEGNVREVFYSPSDSATHPTWSPSGSEIVFMVGPSSGLWKEHLFIADLTDGSLRQLGEMCVDDRPAWVLMPR